VTVPVFPALSGTVRKTTGTLTNPWTFTGRPLDPESGLHFLRNRYYDSRTGTFLTPDPIGMAGGINLYAYVRNNPLNFKDPFGLKVEVAQTPIFGVEDTYHTVIILTPDDGGPRMTLSGHPQDGILTATPNLPNELFGNLRNATKVFDPYGRSEKRWGQRLTMKSILTLGVDAW